MYRLQRFVRSLKLVMSSFMERLPRGISRRPSIALRVTMGCGCSSVIQPAEVRGLIYLNKVIQFSTTDLLAICTTHRQKHEIIAQVVSDTPKLRGSILLRQRRLTRLP